MNFLDNVKSLKKGHVIMVIAALLVFAVVVNIIIAIIQNMFNATEEDRLFKKYSANPQWKQVIDMMILDKDDLKKTDITKAKRVAATMDMGLQWFNLREFKFAKIWWERGLDIEPNNVIGWYNLGNAYSGLKEYSNAEDAYWESIDRARNGDIDACLALGELYKYSYTSKKDKEDDVYLKCLEKSKDNGDLVARLAGYYRDSGDKENAVKWFEKLFGLDPSQEVGDELRALQTKE